MESATAAWASNPLRNRLGAVAGEVQSDADLAGEVRNADHRPSRRLSEEAVDEVRNADPPAVDDAQNARSRISEAKLQLRLNEGLADDVSALPPSRELSEEAADEVAAGNGEVADDKFAAVYF